MPQELRQDILFGFEVEKLGEVTAFKISLRIAQPSSKTESLSIIACTNKVEVSLVQAQSNNGCMPCCAKPYAPSASFRLESGSSNGHTAVDSCKATAGDALSWP